MPTERANGRPRQGRADWNNFGAEFEKTSSGNSRAAKATMPRENGRIKAIPSSIGDRESESGTIASAKTALSPQASLEKRLIALDAEAARIKAVKPFVKPVDCCCPEYVTAACTEVILWI